MPPSDDRPGRDLTDRAERASSDALGEYFVGDVTVAEALTKICEAAIDAVPAAVMAGISMTVDARPGTYVFTTPEVQAVDRPQYDTGDGPCVDAFSQGHAVIIESTLADGPYPAFRRVAAEHGFHSVVSVPMSTGAQVVGALNLYSHEVDGFDASTVADLSPFTTHAAFLLLNHQAYWDARSLSENLQQAMASRAVIEQAKGIIMATTGMSAEDAFEQLRAQSQVENVKVRDLARELVERSHRRPAGP